MVDEDEFFEFLVENRSEDLEIQNDEYIIYCDPNNLHSLNEKIIDKFGNTLSAQLTWKSENNIMVDKQNAEKLFKLLKHT